MHNIQADCFFAFRFVFVSRFPYEHIRIKLLAHCLRITVMNRAVVWRKIYVQQYIWIVLFQLKCNLFPSSGFFFCLRPHWSTFTTEGVNPPVIDISNTKTIRNQSNNICPFFMPVSNETDSFIYLHWLNPNIWIISEIKSRANFNGILVGWRNQQR